MRKSWLSAALILLVAAAFGFQFYQQSSRHPAFAGCYELEDSQLVFGNGRLLIDGVDAGQFRYFKGDATKGPDTIALSVKREIAGSAGIDQRRLLRVGAGGLEVPLDAGGYAMAAPC